MDRRDFLKGMLTAASFSGAALDRLVESFLQQDEPAWQSEGNWLTLAFELPLTSPESARLTLPVPAGGVRVADIYVSWTGPIDCRRNFAAVNFGRSAAPIPILSLSLAPRSGTVRWMAGPCGDIVFRNGAVEVAANCSNWSEPATIGGLLIGRPLKMTDPVQALETSLLAFIEEFTDAHEISVAAVVGTLHVVAYEVLRQNEDESGESEPFDPGLN